MYQDLLETAILAAEAGSRELRRFFRRSDLSVGKKAPNDFVSEADRASEAAIVEVILARYPEHGVLGEEGGVHQAGGGEFEWILDPLDGTANFVHGLPVYAVSIGCRHRGRLAVGVISDPEGDNLFTAAAGKGARWNGRELELAERGLDEAFVATGFPFRAHPALDIFLDAFRQVFQRVSGLRRCGAAALDLAYTAAGVYDGFFEFRLAPWDVAAGALLVREAGGVVTDIDGGDGFLASGNIIAGPPGLQAELREIVAGLTSEAELGTLLGPAPWVKMEKASTVAQEGVRAGD